MKMKKVLFLVIGLLLALITQADTTKELYVGEGYFCNATTYMNLGHAISNVHWEVDANKLHYSESGWTMYVAPTKYYNGEAIVKCSWTEKDQRAPIPYPTYYRSYTWSIRCEDNPIIIDKTEIELSPGESETINYWCTEDNISYYYNCKYEVNFSTQDSRIATVKQTGQVTAVAPGTTYIVVSSPNAMNDVKCKVIVENINVETASIPFSINLVADQSKTLSVTVTPSNATVKTKKWYSADTNTARINESTGELTGVWPGTTKVWCVVNGTVKSNEATVTVTEPSFTFKEFSMTNGATGVDTKPTLTAEFSHNLSRGDNYSDIQLTDGSGQQVNGSLSISGAILKFTPAEHLQPTTNYIWTIPANAVKNKWGTPYVTTRKLSFTTTDWKRMTLSIQPNVKFISQGDQIIITCSAPEATIYYSIDSSTPSKVYTSPIIFKGDMTLQAIARLDGYYDSEKLTHEYLESVEIVKKYPGEESLYNYADVNPYIVFSQQIQEGTQFNRITMKKNGNEMVNCEVLIHKNTLYFVPEEPLEQGCTFTASLPERAILTSKGEANKAIEWTFVTGDYATDVSAGGPELMAALLKDGSLWTWGKRLTEANAENGSYNYTVQTEPGSFVGGDVVAVSSGFMHHAIIKRDGALWMWGRQLCGEFGNGSTTASANPVKVMDGVKSVSCGLQTTAIVKKDSTLWMCGRNDFGQIDDSRTMKQQFVKVAEDIKDVTLGYGFIRVEKADGTSEKRTWDNEIDNQRKPTATGNGIPTELVAVEYGWKNAVALGKDGSVWTWDDSPENTTPTKVIEGRTSSELAGLSAANKTVNVGVQEKAVLTALPVPLNADYASLTWTSGNSTIAKVSSRGVVTGKQKGTTTVTAKISSACGRNYSQQFTVIVDGTPSRGDANRDGTVNMADIGTIINYLAGVTEGVAFDCVDVNGDGTVNVADIITVASIIAE